MEKSLASIILQNCRCSICYYNHNDKNKCLLCGFYINRNITHFSIIKKVECEGKCLKYKSPGPGNHPQYKIGIKWCKKCNLFLNIEKYRCPCCKTKLRTKPKNKTKLDFNRNKKRY